MCLAEFCFFAGCHNFCFHSFLTAQDLIGSTLDWIECTVFASIPKKVAVINYLGGFQAYRCSLVPARPKSEALRSWCAFWLAVRCLKFSRYLYQPLCNITFKSHHASKAFFDLIKLVFWSSRTSVVLNGQLSSAQLTKFSVIFRKGTFSPLL